MTLLQGVRVLDLSEDIAGPYCSKLLADAGADVIKLEAAPHGDRLRSWSTSGRRPPDEAGVLFQYLNTSKRSVLADLRSAEAMRLLDGADLVIESGRLSGEDLRWLRSDFPRTSVVSLSPFGRTGPWSDRPWTEFTLQAMCGSIAGRGTLDREPFYAGGRLGEWIAGTFAAVACLASLAGARSNGGGEHVDLSILECMSIFMGGSAGLQASLSGEPESETPPRSIELPSIEPAADGDIGFCTVTAQQFKDFLTLIERPDLQEVPELASFAGRNARREEFLAIVWDWTKKRRVADIEELAELLRIPIAPIGRPETITELPQFVERGVYVRNPGGFVQPRPPYRVDGQPHPILRAAPKLGEHTGVATWTDRRGPAPLDDPPGPSRLPLAGIRIVDLTAFWAGPAATLVLAALGAEVIKVESVQRPDAMRFTSAKTPADPMWWEWGSVFQGNNLNKLGITLDLRDPRCVAILTELVKTSDALIENYSPRVLDNFGITWERLHEVNERLVMVRMPAFGLSGPWRDRTGFAQTMEQASGMAWLTGFPDGPPVIPRGPCDPLAGMHAAFALLACIEERNSSGEGHFVESTMVEAALNVAAEMVIEYSAYGEALMRTGNRGPVSAPQGIYPCRRTGGRENWLALAVRHDDDWTALCKVMGEAAPTRSATFDTAERRRAGHDLIDAAIGTWCAEREIEEVVSELIAAGIPAARVTEPASVSRNPQMRARGFIEVFDHPVLGRHEVLGMPFRLASHSGPWYRSPSPTIGQHNDEVLGGLLGMSEDELAGLRATSAIGEAPANT